MKSYLILRRTVQQVELSVRARVDDVLARSAAQRPSFQLEAHKAIITLASTGSGSWGSVTDVVDLARIWT